MVEDTGNLYAIRIIDTVWHEKAWLEVMATEYVARL